MANGSIKWNRAALAQVVGSGSEPLIHKATEIATARANAMSAGYRTGIWHDHKTGEVKGETQPVYEGTVEKRRVYPVGQVHTANYAAAKENMEHNTLLKAVPRV